MLRRSEVQVAAGCDCGDQPAVEVEAQCVCAAYAAEQAHYAAVSRGASHGLLANITCSPYEDGLSLGGHIGVLHDLKRCAHYHLLNCRALLWRFVAVFDLLMDIVQSHCRIVF